MFFFFKQKTAYEMRISDWSSDVCSSDLSRQRAWWMLALSAEQVHQQGHGERACRYRTRHHARPCQRVGFSPGRKLPHFGCKLIGRDVPAIEARTQQPVHVALRYVEERHRIAESVARQSRFTQHRIGERHRQRDRKSTRL